MARPPAVRVGFRRLWRGGTLYGPSRARRRYQIERLWERVTRYDVEVREGLYDAVRGPTRCVEELGEGRGPRRRERHAVGVVGVGVHSSVLLLGRNYCTGFKEGV